MNDNKPDIYDLGQMRFGDTVISAGSFKVGLKIKADKQTVTDSYEAVGVKFSEEELEWECDEVLPEFYDMLMKRYDEQKTDKHGLTISTYNFVDGGDYEEQIVLYSCWIESIDKDQDKGTKLSVKGGALKRKKR